MTVSDLRGDRPTAFKEAHLTDVQSAVGVLMEGFDVRDDI